MKRDDTILLIEQRSTVIETVKNVADSCGVKLLVAEDGQEGLDMASAESPDMIIVRRDSPVLDALSMTVLLKQSKETEDIPVIVICAEASASELEKFHDAGCNDCIEEPFTEQELKEHLKEWLP